jgi:hypothetical protein
MTRRVSFRLPDESNIFIIPARKDPYEYESEDIETKKPYYVITRYQ